MILIYLLIGLICIVMTPILAVGAFLGFVAFWFYIWLPAYIAVSEMFDRMYNPKRRNEW